ncbi:MAG: hypothetical protein ACLPKI_06335 [Streptosporangiaceae bacterium]
MIVVLIIITAVTAKPKPSKPKPSNTATNALAASGAQTTTVYPQYPGEPYYLSVDSECAWNIKARPVVGLTRRVW